jgi:leucyl aminopeptidase
MNFSRTQDPLISLQTACIVVGIVQDQHRQAPFSGEAQAAVQKLLDSKDFTAEQGSTLLLYALPGLAAERVLLVGLGEAEKLTVPSFGLAVGKAAIALQAVNVSEAVLCLPSDLDQAAAAHSAILAAAQAVYRFDTCKSEPDLPAVLFDTLTVHSTVTAAFSAIDDAVEQASAIAAGVQVAKDLANLPGNLCTPEFIAQTALELGAAHDKLNVSILEEDEMRALGMGSLLSVSRGSRQPAKLIVLNYQGGQADEAPVALVGKAVTFDAGGISLKPAANMDEMKFDMCGGASVLGTLSACVALQLPLNVIGVIPSSENLPGGEASKPGDIVTSMSGQTIEVLNTDAEGRLLLCDALTYTERFKPAAVIDIATLTGACVVALGHHATGLLANDDALAQAVLAAGETVHDRAWQLPLWDEYAESLKSNFADVANIGDRAAGTITAASFLARFTKTFPWVHLDIAGTAWHSGNKKGATGRPVPLLVQFLLDVCVNKSVPL